MRPTHIDILNMTLAIDDTGMSLFIGARGYHLPFPHLQMTLSMQRSILSLIHSQKMSF